VTPRHDAITNNTNIRYGGRAPDDALADEERACRGEHAFQRRGGGISSGLADAQLEPDRTLDTAKTPDLTPSGNEPRAIRSAWVDIGCRRCRQHDMTFCGHVFSVVHDDALMRPLR
jgi:hypothetical protein